MALMHTSGAACGPSVSNIHCSRQLSRGSCDRALESCLDPTRPLNSAEKLSYPQPSSAPSRLLHCSCGFQIQQRQPKQNDLASLESCSAPADNNCDRSTWQRTAVLSTTYVLHERCREQANAQTSAPERCQTERHSRVLPASICSAQEKNSDMIKSSCQVLCTSNSAADGVSKHHRAKAASVEQPADGSAVAAPTVLGKRKLPGSFSGHHQQPSGQRAFCSGVRPLCLPQVSKVDNTEDK